MAYRVRFKGRLMRYAGNETEGHFINPSRWGSTKFRLKREAKQAILNDMKWVQNHYGLETRFSFYTLEKI